MIRLTQIYFKQRNKQGNIRENQSEWRTHVFRGKYCQSLLHHNILTGSCQVNIMHHYY